MKLPMRGFSNARFRKELHAVNLAQIDAMYEDGEIVNLETLRQKGYLSRCQPWFENFSQWGTYQKSNHTGECNFSKKAKEKLQLG